MGDRVSVSFVLPPGEDSIFGPRKEWESVAVFSHWSGRALVKQAAEYAIALREEAEKQGEMYPLHRLEPPAVVIDFIRHLTKGVERVTNDLYLGKNGEDGDNSDNGHWRIDLSNPGKTIDELSEEE